MGEEVENDIRVADDLPKYESRNKISECSNENVGIVSSGSRQIEVENIEPLRDSEKGARVKAISRQDSVSSVGSKHYVEYKEEIEEKYGEMLTELQKSNLI